MSDEDFLVAVSQRVRSEASEVLERFHMADALDMVSGGKRLRARLVGSLTEKIDDRTVATATAIELLHASTLVHDDIIDRATTRRGQPTISHQYGDNTALLVGNALFARATKIAGESLSSELNSEFCELYEQISSAQNDELAWRGRLRTEQTYQRISAGKTGLLFRFCVRVTGLGELYERIVARISYAFQIVDDIDDHLMWRGESASHASKVAEYDINIGNITLPAILALDHAGVRTEDFDMKAIDDLSNIDWRYGVEESRSRVVAIASEVRKYMKELPQSTVTTSFTAWVEPMLGQLETEVSRIDDIELG